MKKIFLGALVAVLATLGFGLLNNMTASAGAQDCEVYGPDCPTPTQHNGGGGTTTTVVGVTQHTAETTTTVTDTAHVDAATATAATPAAAAPAATSATSATSAANEDSAALAFTGGDIAGMVAIALCLVGLGLVVVRSSRRRASS